MNHMENVARMLGVEMDEIFYIDDKNNGNDIPRGMGFKISDEGLCEAAVDERARPYIIMHLLLGKYEIIKIPVF